jgi:hypothetical protein
MSTCCVLPTPRDDGYPASRYKHEPTRVGNFEASTQVMGLHRDHDHNLYLDTCTCHPLFPLPDNWPMRTYGPTSNGTTCDELPSIECRAPP